VCAATRLAEEFLRRDVVEGARRRAAASSKTCDLPEDSERFEAHPTTAAPLRTPLSGTGAREARTPPEIEIRGFGDPR